MRLNPITCISLLINGTTCSTIGESTPPSIVTETTAPHDPPSGVDPCKTICNLSSAGDCSKVKAVDSICLNLYKDQHSGAYFVSEGRSDLLQVTISQAFGSVSTKSRTCEEICRNTTGCSSSFCKSNNHCQGLFWNTLHPEVFCFQTIANPCQHNTPLHCNPESPGGSGPEVEAMRVPRSSGSPTDAIPQDTRVEHGTSPSDIELNETTAQTSTVSPDTAIEAHASIGNSTSSANDQGADESKSLGQSAASKASGASTSMLNQLFLMGIVCMHFL